VTALFAAFGVDYTQWKALTLVALKLDFRMGSFVRSRFSREARGIATLVSQVIFYSIYGLFMAIIVWASRDVFLAGTVLMTYVMFMVGTAVLLDHNSALTSPHDYGILGFRPISSRTYFAARLANVLAYTTAITTVTTYLPALSLFIRHGFAVGLAGVAAFYACSLFTAFGILFGYGWLMRLIGADALKRALSYVQLAMSFFIYGGYFMMSRFAGSRALASAALPKTAWIFLYPATWFAAYLEIAAGETGVPVLLPALASIAALAALVVGLGGRLSMDYSDRLAGIASSSQRVRPARAASGPGWWFRADEARAVALLVRSQFRNDQRFRMGVLSILPITLIYVFMGVNDGNMRDPFVASTHGTNFSLVTMAVILFPSMLKPALTRSDSFRASWVFFACPADRLQVIRSAKNVVVAFFLIPYLLFIAAIYLYFTHNILHVVVHIALLGLISHLILQAFVLLDPELPFSRPAQTGGRSTAVLVLMMLLGLVSGLLQAFSPLVYRSVTATAIAFGSLLLVTIVLDLLTRARVERQAKSLEFAG
jgi:hypothetical protein